jgi:hypothetical protein
VNEGEHLPILTDEQRHNPQNKRGTEHESIGQTGQAADQIAHDKLQSSECGVHLAGLEAQRMSQPLSTLIFSRKNQPTNTCPQIATGFND